jgi:carboxymethylenebutenolidase
MSEPLSLHSPEGHAFDAFLNRPDGEGPAPAVVVVPSIMGVTDGLKQTMERYASYGYYVLAADPFWRTIPGPLDVARRDEAMQRMEAWTVDQGLSDMRVTLDALDELPQWNRKFAVLGICFGGQHAVLGLTEFGADAAVTFHGVGMYQHLARPERIAKPFSFHFAEHDPVVPLAEVDQIRSALAAKDGEIYVYAGADHGFAQEESRNYHREAGTLSERRAFAVLDRLKTAPVR